jgi:hypothetical protein
VLVGLSPGEREGFMGGSEAFCGIFWPAVTQPVRHTQHKTNPHSSTNLLIWPPIFPLRRAIQNSTLSGVGVLFGLPEFWIKSSFLKKS